MRLASSGGFVNYFDCDCEILYSDVLFLFFLLRALEILLEVGRLSYAKPTSRISISSHKAKK
jgi:hypothetical protein